MYDRENAAMDPRAGYVGADQAIERDRTDLEGIANRIRSLIGTTEEVGHNVSGFLGRSGRGLPPSGSLSGKGTEPAPAGHIPEINGLIDTLETRLSNVVEVVSVLGRVG